MMENANKVMLSMLCSKCRHIFEGWDEALLKLRGESNISLPHWDNFHSFEISAQDCDLCYLFLNQLSDKDKAMAKKVGPPKLSVTAEPGLFLTIVAREEICREFSLYVPLLNNSYAMAHGNMVQVESLGSVLLHRAL
jgi:hypothetical protein